MIGRMMAAVVAAGLGVAPAWAGCPAGTSAFTETRLFLGRDIGDDGVVSDADWAGFVAAEVVPRFPAGFSTFDGVGVWAGCQVPDIAGGCETMKMIMVQYSPGPASDIALDEIAAVYIKQFGQTAVMRSDHAVCTRFYAPGGAPKPVPQHKEN